MRKPRLQTEIQAAVERALANVPGTTDWDARQRLAFMEGYLATNFPKIGKAFCQLREGAAQEGAKA